MYESYKIPFNRPFLTGQELHYIGTAVQSGKISGNGQFTLRCQDFFKNRYGFHHTLMTSSCTDALEMCALLLNVGPNDEVILPSYTFVSTANAFALRGAKLVFADSLDSNPNIDPGDIENLVTSRTKAIVLVHYAGISCDMKRICDLAAKANVPLVEDSAHAVDAYHEMRPLGSFGDLSTFSFHETKNVICGEGGMLVVNNPKFKSRSEIIWEKGTNRVAFSRREVSKYEWVDIGSSFLTSELAAAYLLAQLENIDKIQNRRKEIWNRYLVGLKHIQDAGKVSLPIIPPYARPNGHLFYLMCGNLAERGSLIGFLQSRGILAVFHYLPLHRSPFYQTKHDGRVLSNADKFSDCLIRLPLFYDLKDSEVDEVIDAVTDFYTK